MLTGCPMKTGWEESVLVDLETGIGLATSACGVMDDVWGKAGVFGVFSVEVDEA